MMFTNDIYFIIKQKLPAEVPRWQVTASNPQENVEFSLFLCSFVQFKQFLWGVCFRICYFGREFGLATCSQLFLQMVGLCDVTSETKNKHISQDDALSGVFKWGTEHWNPFCTCCTTVQSCEHTVCILSIFSLFSLLLPLTVICTRALCSVLQLLLFVLCPSPHRCYFENERPGKCLLLTT